MAGSGGRNSDSGGARGRRLSVYGQARAAGMSRRQALIKAEDAGQLNLSRRRFRATKASSEAAITKVSARHAKAGLALLNTGNYELPF